MDKLAALQTFLNGFLPAYEENSIYSLKNPPAFPYLTYEGIDSSFEEGLCSMSFSTWYREASWVNSVQMAKRISKAIPSTGLMLHCDDGGVLIYKGTSPFAHRMGDDSDDLIKRTVFSLDIRFYTVF